MPNFTQSHYYKIGAGHTYCEDYALATTLADARYAYGVTMPTNPVALVSDGCSSLPDTDVGSRLITYEAARQLRTLIQAEKFQPTVFRRKIDASARKTARRMGFDWPVLGATLLGGFVMCDTCYIFVYGDGYWFHRSTDGALTICEIEYSGNAPPYLVYSDEVYEGLVHDFGGRATVTTRIFDIDDYQEKTEIQDRARQFLYKFPLADTVEFGVATDGFGSFANPEGIDGIEMVRTVLELPQHTTKHIAHQVTRMLNGNTRRHGDDLGIAVIQVER